MTQFARSKVELLLIGIFFVLLLVSLLLFLPPSVSGSAQHCLSLKRLSSAANI